MATPPPLWKVALLGQCPRCGQGELFRGLLDIRDSCDMCGLDLRAHDAGVGPAVAGIFVIGALTVGLAIRVDVRFAPPLWVHAVPWYRAPAVDPDHARGQGGAGGAAMAPSAGRIVKGAQVSGAASRRI